MTAVDPAAPSAPEALDEEAAVDPAALAADADAAYEALVRMAPEREAVRIEAAWTWREDDGA